MFTITSTTRAIRSQTGQANSGSVRRSIARATSPTPCCATTCRTQRSLRYSTQQVTAMLRRSKPISPRTLAGLRPAALSRSCVLSRQRLIHSCRDARPCNRQTRQDYSKPSHFVQRCGTTVAGRDLDFTLASADSQPSRQYRCWDTCHRNRRSAVVWCRVCPLGLRHRQARETKQQHVYQAGDGGDAPDTCESHQVLRCNWCTPLFDPGLPQEASLLFEWWRAEGRDPVQAHLVDVFTKDPKQVARFLQSQAPSTWSEGEVRPHVGELAADQLKNIQLLIDLNIMAEWIRNHCPGDFDNPKWYSDDTMPMERRLVEQFMFVFNQWKKHGELT